ncbi:hypothetical protein CRG98_050259 [Punica granatum]|uniref:1-phosphatidylinositol-4-phosphate 5-kinase n=1 Tax=Punica granatum TaxID=22663 RepID=A0A2I0GKJ8_PUNGR|nr:hypothetical protein CRG98_050259 [Punica granatum]
MPARAEQIPGKEEKQMFHESYDVVLYLGIIDILQEYNMTKKIEHAYKSIQFDSLSISAVDPAFYSRRFLEFIQKLSNSIVWNRNVVCAYLSDSAIAFYNCFSSYQVEKLGMFKSSGCLISDESTILLQSSVRADIVNHTDTGGPTNSGAPNESDNTGAQKLHQTVFIFCRCFRSSMAIVHVFPPRCQTFTHPRRRQRKTT